MTGAADVPFYKVGLGDQDRIDKHVSRHAGNKVVFQQQSTRLACYDVEQLVLKMLDSSRFTPDVPGSWASTECLHIGAPVGGVLAQVAHLLLDITDDDAIEVAIARSIDCSTDALERLIEQGRIEA